MPLSLSLALTPRGHLRLIDEEGAPLVDPAFALRAKTDFERGEGYGLMLLGIAEHAILLPPLFAWWRELGTHYASLLRLLPEDATAADIPAPAAFLSAHLLSAPLMIGEEYLNANVLKNLWAALVSAFVSDWQQSTLALQDFLKSLNPAWNQVGRVSFNLAENRRDDDFPFAFLVTYTDRISLSGQARHLPLSQALKEYAGNNDRLLSLLVPVQRACEHCAWLRFMVEQGEIFHPLRWGPKDALQLLNDAPLLEQAGVMLRLPNQWKAGRPARAKVSASIGESQPSLLGLNALLDFSMHLDLAGDALSEAEIASLLTASDGLVMIRGQWVEVDSARLSKAIEKFEQIKALAQGKGLSFVEGMRLLTGINNDTGGAAQPETPWFAVSAGTWLRDTLVKLRAPEQMDKVLPGDKLQGTLRPYQESGVRWLHLLSSLGLGACLADDMGLGKTIQIISLLLVHAHENPTAAPALLLVPTSLLANWASEIERFAPDFRFAIAHPSFINKEKLNKDILQGVSLVITSYGSLLRMTWLQEVRWSKVIADEAQALKNPGARQTKLAKTLNANTKIAMTGTPVENRLSDLWSIFDFINPGLLGSAKKFSDQTKKLQGGDFSALREFVRPYILRRLKTDRSIITDLPDKTEMKAFCALSKKQVVLYQQSVAELTQQLLEKESGIERRGLVLSFLMRFKQICNHPSQWLSDGAWEEADSGKFARLREICEVIAQKQEKVLVFTQFRETTEPLQRFLTSIFGQPGLVLHGGTPVKTRKTLVQKFQEDESLPFFILSIKAGGSGLNLTAASHVIHFDRWWNPAVENQATDRAYRIGQKRNVLVHKFICRGSIEEKIDALITSKTTLSDNVLDSSAESALTEMDNDALLRLVTLDLDHALKES